MDGWKTSLLLGWLHGKWRVFPGTIFCWGLIYHLHILMKLGSGWKTGKHRNLQKILITRCRIDWQSFLLRKVVLTSNLFSYLRVLQMGQNLPEKPFLMKTLPTCHFRRHRSTASSISSPTCRAAAGIDGKNSTAGHSASKARASVVPTSMGLNRSSMV